MQFAKRSHTESIVTVRAHFQNGKRRKLVQRKRIIFPSSALSPTVDPFAHLTSN